MRLHEYVRRAARRTPDAPAVHGPDGELTYRELDELADRMAAGLVAGGLRPGDRVVIWAEKSTRMVALMQAALRAGLPYVPVSPGNPYPRVCRIAADCTAAVLVADPGRAERAERAGRTGPVVPEPTCPVTTFDELVARGGGPAPWYDNAPDDPAYILYTSGSTGAPKGVCLSHRNGWAFVEWAGDLLDVGPGDRLANHAPFNFDLSVFDLYASFRAGASLHLVPAELSYTAAQLVDFIRSRGITIWYSVPSALVLMTRDGGLLDGPVPLRACVFAGEPMPVSYAQQLARAWPGVRLFNWYGPTETNVCTFHELPEKLDPDDLKPLPIGIPASGDTVTLDPSGEIVVDGPTVMLGYWGHPPHRGPYRTGDIGRYGPDGVLEFVGRRDNMAKVRGHRVEPGEIESVLSGHPDIADVAVVVVGTGVDARLHAVIVPTDRARMPGTLAVKGHCAQRLPTYMIVDFVHKADRLPLTPNGKTDRTVLVTAIEGGEL